MFRIYVSLFLFIFTFIWFTFSFNQVDLTTYKNIKSIISKKINKKIIINYNKLACNYFIINNDYYISPWCFLQDNIPKLWIKKTSDLVFPFIKNLDNIYDLKSTSFVSNPSQVKFSYVYDLDKFISNSLSDKILLHILAFKNYYIKVPSIFLAFKEFKNYSLYVSSKDLSKRNKWRLINFNIAIKTLNNYILNPYQELNFNKLVANKPWYYKQNSKSKYLFYGWVCWASTMLFRNALINPYLYVTKRYNHSQRYVYFYSPYIYGDDASIYEYIKVLKIKNISSYPIYFKEKHIWKEIYLVSIVPKKTWKFVYITKKQTWPLSAYVSSTTFDRNWNILYKQSWVSNYKNKNYEK